MIRLQKILALSVAICALAACTTSIVAPINKDVNATNDQTKTLMQQAQRGDGPTQQERQASVHYSKELWLPTSREKEVKAKGKSQAVLHQHFTENYEFRSLSDVAERLTVNTKIPVYVGADTMPVSATSTTGNAAQKTATPQTGYNTLPSFQSGQVGANQYQQVVNLQYDGELQGFLDLVAARFNVSWDWTDGKINFFRYTTRTFKITALPGDTSSQANVTNTNGSGSGSSSGGSSSGSGSSGGGSATTSNSATSTTTVSYQSNIFNNIADSVKSMTTRKEGVVPVPSTSSIIVTDTPQILDRVAAFIDDQNQSLSRQVTINIRILSLTLNDSDEYGLNLAALYNSLNGNVNFGLSNSFSTGSSDSNLTFKVPGVAGSGVLGNPAIKAFQGSQAILSALSQQGRVRTISNVSLPTLNNQAAPLQVGNVNGYLQSSSTTLAANVGQTSALTPGSITSGISMNVVPNVIDHTHLLLQYDMHITSVPTMTPITSGGATIQIPNYATQNFLQRISADSGDTLIVTGFEQDTSSGTSQGVGNANNAALGGGVDTSKGRVVIIIMIQPIVGEDVIR